MWCVLIALFGGMTRRFPLSFNSPEAAQPRLWSGSCLFYALFELLSKFPLMKAAQSQRDDMEVMVMAGRMLPAWFLGSGYGEEKKFICSSG